MRTAAGVRPTVAISEDEEQRLYADSSIEEKLGRTQIDADEEEDPAQLTFTVSWDDFCSHFDSLFLNWDPGMFNNSVTVHSSWRGGSSSQSSGAASSGSKQPDPHFRLSVSLPPSVKGGANTAADGPSREIWVLLTRHIATTSPIKQAAATGSKQSLRDASTDYIAVHAFEDNQYSPDNGQLTTSPAPALRQSKHKGAYVDGTHVLVRLKPSIVCEKSKSQDSNKEDPQQCSFTIVVPRRSESDVMPSSSTTDQKQDADKTVNYTLSVFSRYPMELSELRTRLPYCESVAGSWTTRTAVVMRP